MEHLSPSLLGQISSLIANIHHPNPFGTEDTSAFPGYSGAHKEPVPIRSQSPLSHLTSPRAQSAIESLVRKGGTGARVSGLAQGQRFYSDRGSKPRVAQLPLVQEVLSGIPSGSGGNVGGREHCVDDDDENVDDDDDDDFNDPESIAGAPADRRLCGGIDYIYERFQHSETDAAASVKPCCHYVEFFSVSNPPEP